MDTKNTPIYGLEHVTKIRQIIDNIGTMNPLNLSLFLNEQNET